MKISQNTTIEIVGKTQRAKTISLSGLTPNIWINLITNFIFFLSKKKKKKSKGEGYEGQYFWEGIVCSEAHEKGSGDCEFLHR